MKWLIAYDLDGTLAESSRPMSEETAETQASPLDVVNVAVISSGDGPQFDKQLASRLSKGAARERLWLMPTTGTRLYRFVNDERRTIHAKLFDDAEKASIRAAFDRGLADAGLANERIWGERIGDRGRQNTFSGVGQAALLEKKEALDPDRAKRTALQTTRRGAPPNLSINRDDRTSIDLTRAGVDKGYGLGRLSKDAGVPLAGTLFVGDAIYPCGNDYPAVEAGVDTGEVCEVAATRAVMAAIIACLERS